MADLAALQSELQASYATMKAKLDDSATAASVRALEARVLKLEAGQTEDVVTSDELTKELAKKVDKAELKSLQANADAEHATTNKTLAALQGQMQAFEGTSNNVAALLPGAGACLLEF
jgi:hypothetical protein